MTPQEHQQKAARLLELSDGSMHSPLGWSFEWTGTMPPRILDSNGEVVCVLSTGSMEGAYSIDTIIANAKRLLNNNQ